MAATASGYAACMFGAIDRAALHAAFGLPLNLDIQLVVALGRPGEAIRLKVVGAGNSVA